ncbi:COX11 [Scenedesmus sp. PABB004]|nr:COX11 [Scenedesmus sp. PABB004]
MLRLGALAARAAAVAAAAPGAGAPSAAARALDPLQQAPLWAEVLAAARRAPPGGPWGAGAWAAATLQQARCAAQSAGYQQARAKREKRIQDNALYLGAVVLGMVGFSYASVPLYRAFCQATGYGGAVGRSHNIEAKLAAREAAPDAELDAKCAAREIRVWFSSDVADDMPWRFTPTQEYVTVHPGESTLAFFTAQNKSDRAITGVSTYNVVPDKAAYYFNKVQCFCFEEQRLRGGEVVDMPVFFYIDPELVTDHNCRNIHDITLSYTFFKVVEDDSDGDEAEAEADSSGGGVRLHGPGAPAAQLSPAAAAAIAAAGGGGGAPQPVGGGGGAAATAGAGGQPRLRRDGDGDNNWQLTRTRARGPGRRRRRVVTARQAGLGAGAGQADRWALQARAPPPAIKCDSPALRRAPLLFGAWHARVRDAPAAAADTIPRAS